MKLRHRTCQFNTDDLPLFAFVQNAERRLARPLPLPARRIRDRFGLSAAAAAITAELAGFAMGGDR